MLPLRLLALLAIWAMNVPCLHAQKMPEIEYFKGKKQVRKGEKVRLVWRVNKAKTILLQNDLTQEQKRVGKVDTFIFIAEKEYAFTLIADRKGKIATKQLKGKILKKMPAIEIFTGSALYNITDQAPAYLQWKVRDAKFVLLGNSYPITNLDTLVPMRPDSTRRFELLAIGEEGDTVRAQHTIKVSIGMMKFGVVDGTNTQGLVKGIDNKIQWDFAGASWVMLPERKDTLPAQSHTIVRPDTEKDLYIQKFYVKYPNEAKPRTIEYKDWIMPAKVYFKPSALRCQAGEEVTLSWNTRGLSNISVWVGEQKMSQQPATGKHVFLFTKDTEVRLEGFDVSKQAHSRTWNIRNATRPFIRNAVAFQDWKKSGRGKLMMEIFEIDRSKFPQEVKLRVLVADTAGNFVRGMAPPELSEQEAKKIFLGIVEKTEKGTSEQITNFKVREVNQMEGKHHDIGLCLDYSGSMMPFKEALEEATIQLLDTKVEKDRYSIVRFSTDLILDTKMKQSNNDLVKIWNNRARIFESATALYAGADEALDTFDSTSTNQKALFLLTDGEENSSFSHAGKGRAFNAQQIVQKARKRGIKIYPIGLGDGTNEKLLKDMAWLTDGKALFGYNPRDVEGIYKELGYTFKNYYEITYTPKMKDEGKHEISLRYHDNLKESSTSTRYYIGDGYQILEDGGFTTNKKVGKQPAVPKQAVAFFDFDKDNLKPMFTPNIDAIASFLQRNTKTTAEIWGHTDLVGTPEKNLDLSRRRAETVKAYLVGNGIDATRLTVKQMGMTSPVWKRENEAWQAQENRRIEIIVWE